ncbi:hypothetical protein COU01_04100 [Candidatus Falkowbacteria bacterium CG10_big_fil_rev_8_21_14_0_10_44_15]|uniref:TonB C-terminal domain-containing protein n=1 Tax=Candidatus Falkowbacteria bacterium CG10_big_fil_rev_8_21_14_0_10_44_15 TaxID=1974569 RepID=A0A2H0V0N2_9BACT|nr:MAG: hypothetical protein COU01_04100 [Candidatus Falkowbacteria bacterium CG10_big_fil_rev_8_21_14_0_10_44_15]
MQRTLRLFSVILAINFFAVAESQEATSPYPIIFIPGLSSASYDFGYYSEGRWDEGLIGWLLNNAGYTFGASFYWPEDQRSNGGPLAWVPTGEEGRFDISLNIDNLSALRGNIYTFTFPIESQINGNTFIEMVNDLGTVVTIVKAINNAPKVILVGRSKGGLVAKAYLQSRSYGQRNDVAMFVSLGTPFLGSSTAVALDAARQEVVTAEHSFNVFLRSIQNRTLQYFTAAFVPDYLQSYWRDITVKDLYPLAAEELINKATNFVGLPIETIYFCFVYQDIVHDVYGDGGFSEYVSGFDPEGRIARLNNIGLLDFIPKQGGDSVVNVWSQNLRHTRAGRELGPERIMVLYCGAVSSRSLYPLHLQESRLPVTYSQFMRAMRGYQQINQPKPTYTPTPTATARPTPTPTVTPTPTSTPTPVSVSPEIIEEYMSRLTEALGNAWNPPNDPWIGIVFWREEYLRAEVSFVIQNNGTITNIQLTESAGWNPVDESALAAVRSVSPFEPLPSGYPEPVLNVNMGFKLWL